MTLDNNQTSKLFHLLLKLSPEEMLEVVGMDKVEFEDIEYYYLMNWKEETGLDFDAEIDGILLYEQILESIVYSISTDQQRLAAVYDYLA